MTKKDFELVAATVKLARDDYLSIGWKDEAYGMTVIAGRLAGAFADQHPRFDSKIFLTACGLGE